MNSNSNCNIFFPPEWYPQSCVQLTWPHEGTDWAGSLDETIGCFAAIAKAISRTERLLVVAPRIEPVRALLGDSGRIIFREIDTNDTWARDHGGISVLKDGRPTVYDFTFNGWGMKFAANLDNLITRRLFASSTFAPGIACEQIPLVLEGGSIETDGGGTLLVTASCLESANRNEHLSRAELEQCLGRLFGARRILWLNHGRLIGDDTDGHIDTLARFCSDSTIVYVRCDDPSDPHFEELRLMEEELRGFVRDDGQPYRLVPLPLPACVEHDGERLPATYANFLITNRAVLMPLYDAPTDELAMHIIRELFPGREATGINCLPLVRQHGSLHCVSMQYPEGFII
ncbi:MAG: agmatine deiminase family protein [Tannerellaceae bacterium]|jgi:agmatine/peptidylarginine deiminase|nr:agmatine deiminase family protein [Tannerellaceae bacterium]